MSIKLPERYLLKHLLGEGGMGRVFLAYDNVLGEDVAIKVLQPAKSQREKEAQQFVFQAEVRSAANLYHPRVVPLYDAGSLIDESPYYSMRYISGGSLAPLRAAPPPWPTLAEILDQTLEGLAFAHARGVVHRDIKPHNILLEPRQQGGYEAFLADLSLVRPFGFSAKSAVKGRRTVSISGTPPYMAPEQYDEQGRDIGPWTDLYSLGVMIFELVAGYLPFEGEFLEVVFAKGTKKAPPLIPRPGYPVPSGLDKIVSSLLEKNPASRFELAADVRAALRELDPVDTANAAQILTLPPKDIPTLLSVSTKDNVKVEWEKQKATDQSDLYCPPLPLPTPLPLPVHPPSDPGRGALTRSSLPLYTYRRPAMIGRRALQKQLWQITKEVLEQKKSRIILLEGETGVGKSRLALWLAESLEELGVMRVIQVKEESSDPLSGAAGGLSRLIGGFGLEKGPLRNRIQTYLEAYQVENPAEETQALWRWLASKNPEELPPAEERNSLFARAASRVAWRGATCIWFDDMPRDRVAEGLLHHLLEVADRDETPFLLLLTPRELDVASPFYEALLKHSDLTRFKVNRLGKKETKFLVEELLSLSPHLIQFVAQKSAGNPLFAIQLVGHWIEAQLLNPTLKNTKTFELADGVEPSRLLPPTLSEIFRIRIAEVIKRAKDPEAIKEALHVAALLGLSFSWGIFLEVLEKRIDKEQARIGAWAAIASGLIKAVQGGRTVIFDNAMLRDSIKEEVLERADAPALQRELAKVLEKHAFDLETLAQAAEYWEGAGDGLRAAQIYLRAGQAGFRADIKRTSWALHRAFALAKNLKGIQIEARIHLELARAARLLGTPDQSVHHAETAISLVNDKEVEAEARLAIGQVARQKLDHQKALEEFSLAREAASDVQDRLALAKALLGLGDVAYTQGDLPVARDHFEEAKQLSAKLRDPFLPGRVLNRLGDVYRAFADMENAAGHYGQARLQSAQRGDRITELTALSGLGDVAMATGDLLGAVENFEKAYHLSQLANFPEGLLASVLNLAAAYLELRTPEKALKYLVEGEGYLPKSTHWAKPLLHLVTAWAEAMIQNPQSAYQRLQSAQQEGLEKYTDPDAARAAEGCGDEAALYQESNLASLAYNIAIQQFSALGRQDDANRMIEKKKKLFQQNI